MALQSYVNTEYALGVAGDEVNPGEGQNIFTPVNPVAEGPVNVGSFVFPGSDPYTTASNSVDSSSAGSDSYAFEAGSVSGDLTVSSDGSDITLQSSAGAVNKTNGTATTANGTLTILVGTDFSGNVTLGGQTIATVADGSATLGSTLTATGTNSTVTVSAVTYSGSDLVVTFDAAWTATVTATEVMGFVKRNQFYPMYDITSAGTLTVPEGSALSVAVRGDFYAVSSTDATIGQAVFASTADGSVSTGTAGSPGSGKVDTGWTVKRGGAAGELIVIGRQ